MVMGYLRSKAKRSSETFMSGFYIAHCCHNCVESIPNLRNGRLSKDPKLPYDQWDFWLALEGRSDAKSFPQAQHTLESHLQIAPPLPH